VDRAKITSLFVDGYTMMKPNDWLSTNIGVWKKIGVQSLFFVPDGATSLEAIRIAKDNGLKIGMEILTKGNVIDEPVDSMKANCEKYAPFADYWYSCEVNMNDAWPRDLASKIINAGLSIKEIPVYISSIYWTSGKAEDDNLIRSEWTSFVKTVNSLLIKPAQIAAIFEDSVGCGYIVPNRNPGTPAYQDMLVKLAIHKEVCESNRWWAGVNCELFDYDYTPAKPGRIAYQIAMESQFASEGMGIGPCWQASDLSVQKDTQ
jgi:hypothetical protein